MGEKTEFTVIFNYAKEQLPIAKANLAASDIPYEIVKQDWLSGDKTRAIVTFGVNSKADAKRLRKMIPVQRGLQCGCFVAAEYPEELRLSGLGFKKRALELGYSKYSVDFVRYRLEHCKKPFDWKTVSREELENVQFCADYPKGIGILLGVQRGDRCDKQPTWRNAVQRWDGERGEVKDKIYYIAEALGVPKGYLHHILNIDETTLRKWSYNPANVTSATSEKIFRRIAYMDLMGLKLRKVNDERIKDLAWDEEKREFLWPPNATDYLWEIQSRYEGTVQTRDFWQAASAMLCRVENWESRKVVNYSEEAVCMARTGKRSNRGQTPRITPHYSRIANNRKLEMPVGVTRWDESLLLVE